MAGGIVETTATLIRYAVFSPRSLFEHLKRGGLTKETLIVFVVSAIITFTKTIFVVRNKYHFTFFYNNVFNRVVVWLNNPLVHWATVYIGYFVFILLVFVACRFFNKKVRFNKIALSLMSISGFGVVMHVVFYLLRLACSKEVVQLCVYVVYVWVVVLSIWGIKSTQDLPLSRSLICVLFPAMPFVFAVSLVGITPYLAWLTV